MEHAWADIGHEMTYKTELKVPSHIHRQFASLAAVLEGVDRQFGVLVRGLDDFKSNFGAYHERKEVEAEIARLRIVLSYDADNLALAVKIAQLALSIGRHRTALEVLEPYKAKGDQGVQRLLGAALTEMYEDQPGSPAYLAGRQVARSGLRPSHSTTPKPCVRWLRLGCAKIRRRPATCSIRRLLWTLPSR